MEEDYYSVAHAPSQFTVDGKHTYTITKPGLPVATMTTLLHPLNTYEAKTSDGIINKFYFVKDKQQFVMIPCKEEDEKKQPGATPKTNTISAKPWIRGELGVPLNPDNSFFQQMITLCHIRAQILAGSDKSIHHFGKDIQTLSKNLIRMRQTLHPEYIKGVLDTVWSLLNDSQKQTLFHEQLNPVVVEDPSVIHLYNHVFNSRA